MLKCGNSTESDQKLLQCGYHTECHDTVGNSNPLEWRVRLSCSCLSGAEVTHGLWKPSSMAEAEKPVLSGTLSCSPSPVSLGLGPELFCYMAPLDCPVITVLRQCLLLVGQRRACSSWKSVLEGNTARPSVVVLGSALSLLCQAL